jgi:hypothetical protein
VQTEGDPGDGDRLIIPIERKGIERLSGCRPFIYPIEVDLCPYG